MIVAIGADHAGRPLVERVLQAVHDAGHTCTLVHHDGEGDADDYPDVARAVVAALRTGEADRAVLVCGSGAGVSVAANKFRGIRAAMAHDTYTAAQMVEHDDCNVLCLGARVIGPELAAACTQAFVDAEFTSEARHVRRVGKITSIEEEQLRA